MTKGTRKGREYLSLFEKENVLVVYEGMLNEYYPDDDTYQYSVKLKKFIYGESPFFKTGEIHKIRRDYFYEIGDHALIRHVFKKSRR
jgi:hypothetical protein